ncbi:MAG: hypothetical protein JWN53_2523 [Gemmatimonadetes bacterium]|nr:hypothetical protein [Gemmatimonadota bacterium]
MTQLSTALRLPHRMTLRERLLLNVLIDRLAQRDILLLQARAGRVHWEQTNGQPALMFAVPEGTERASADGLVAEGEARDVDNGVIHLLLHLNQGMLSTIAFHREDGNPIIALPEALSVRRE